MLGKMAATTIITSPCFLAKQMEEPIENIASTIYAMNGYNM